MPGRPVGAALLAALFVASACAGLVAAQANDVTSRSIIGGTEPPAATCSCASPTSVPLANGTSYAADLGTWVGDVFYASQPSGSRATSRLAAGVSYSYSPATALCNSLRRADEGEQCGAATAVCRQGLCCSQRGFCSRTPDDCDGTCQCAYSGPGSNCRGSYPFPTPPPRTLPTAPRGGVCSPYVATCPRRQCCSQFGFCVDDGSIYCSQQSCRPTCSPLSSACLIKNQATKTSRYTWVVSWKTLAPDGFSRPVIVVNGEPFKTLEATVGERVIIKVVNKLNEPLTIHWHGMLQRMTNIMDGVSTGTQRPTPPGESFVYNFIADTPGSFWWHSHYKAQYIDGLWGPFIIRDPSDKRYEAESVLAVNEWYHEVSNVLLDYYASPLSQGNEPVPYDSLMNFVGQGNATGSAASYAYIKGAAGFCNNPKTKLRIMDTGGFARFNVSVDNHRMIIVAEDGVQVEPLEVGSLQINNGQRYDVLVCQRGPVLSKEPVWIRAVMDDADFAYPSTFNTSLGVLYFTRRPPARLPTTTAKFEVPALNPSVAPGGGNISPYALNIVGGVRPPPATRVTNFTILFFNEPPTAPIATQYAHFNNISLSMQPVVPSLLERYSNNPQGLGPPATVPSGLGWNLLEVQRGEVIDIVINNQDTGEHPIHMHGHWFWILAAGEPNAGDWANQQPLVPRLARDTVTVNLKSYLVLRMVANNPGAWILHCHIDWHLAIGLGLYILEGFPAAV